ncbi:MAG: adenylate/guanylate cyclase domain-containing protein [Gemmatimonadota bacterium]
MAVRVCAQCGQENPEGARFCNACAVPLPVEVPAGVRKTVTVLFCDLVGSTSLGDRADPELLRELMGSYHTELRTILERHGGTVEKFVGDAAMAVFGIPQIHEDDALRAVRAATGVRSPLLQASGRRQESGTRPASSALLLQMQRSGPDPVSAVMPGSNVSD